MRRLFSVALAGMSLAPFAPEACAPPPVTVQQDVTQRANTERANVGARRVVRDATLERAAQLHAEDQARMDRMSHYGSDGSTSWQRLARVGYTSCFAGADLVAAGSSTPALVVQAWMGSTKGHREALLNGVYTDVGVGRAVGASGYVYWALYLTDPC